MDITGNTILITGGGTGIGRGLAEALHAKGNHIIVAGRRAEPLDEVARANPGIATAQVDMAYSASIAALASRVAAEHPALNVVIQNAGIMMPEDMTADGYGAADAEAIIATNLLGPIRLTAALLPHLKDQARVGRHRLVRARLRAARRDADLQRDQGGDPQLVAVAPGAAVGHRHRGGGDRPPSRGDRPTARECGKSELDAAPGVYRRGHEPDRGEPGRA